MTSDLTTMTAGSLALFLVLGAGVGFAGGLFAIGGALIAIPLLTAVFAFTQHDAQGTAMVMALSSAFVTPGHLRSQEAHQRVRRTAHDDL
jgi:uncharacterized membrane protein YfcA